MTRLSHIVVNTLLVLAALLCVSVSTADPRKMVDDQICGDCHAAAVSAWQSTKHFATSRFASHSLSVGYAKALGLNSQSLAELDSPCASCHVSSRLDENQVRVTGPVSCQSCHGPAADWLNLHSDFGDSGTAAGESAQQKSDRHNAMTRAGMIYPEDVSSVASNCVTCHLVNDQKLINETTHPDGSNFDFVASLQGQIRHYPLADEEKLKRLAIAGNAALTIKSWRELAVAIPGTRYGDVIQSLSRSASQQLLADATQRGDSSLVAVVSEVPSFMMVSGNRTLASSADVLESQVPMSVNAGETIVIAGLDEAATQPVVERPPRAQLELPELAELVETAPGIPDSPITGLEVPMETTLEVEPVIAQKSEVAEVIVPTEPDPVEVQAAQAATVILEPVVEERQAEAAPAVAIVEAEPEPEPEPGPELVTEPELQQEPESLPETAPAPTPVVVARSDAPSPIIVAPATNSSIQPPQVISQPEPATTNPVAPVAPIAKAQSMENPTAPAAAVLEPVVPVNPPAPERTPSPEPVATAEPPAESKTVTRETTVTDTVVPAETQVALAPSSVSIEAERPKSARKQPQQTPVPAPTALPVPAGTPPTPSMEVAVADTGSSIKPPGGTAALVLITDAELVTPLSRAFCNSANPWRRGSQARQLSELNTGDCFGLRIAKRAGTQLHLLAETPTGNFVRLLPNYCNYLGVEAEKLVADNQVELPQNPSGQFVAEKLQQPLKAIYIVVASNEANSLLREFTRSVPDQCTGTDKALPDIVNTLEALSTESAGGIGWRRLN